MNNFEYTYDGMRAPLRANDPTHDSGREMVNNSVRA